jgi:hypothetical protein
MKDALIALAVFACLAGASLGAMWIYPMMALRHRDDETNTVVRLIANIFVVMTSLVFGLMINSAKNTYESIDASVHAYATDIIILDRTLRTYGLAGVDARNALIAYVEAAISHPARADDSERDKPDSAAAMLYRLGDKLAAIQPADSYHQAILLDARGRYSRIVERRWAIVEQSEGTIPVPLIAMLVAWLSLIFASFGYRAPANAVVMASFVVAAALIAAAFYLVLNMDVPFSGPIQISDTPLRRVLVQMKP